MSICYCPGRVCPYRLDILETKWIGQFHGYICLDSGVGWPEF